MAEQRDQNELLTTPPRIVFLGAPGVGKTSLIRLLLGNDALPAPLLDATRQPILIRYAAEPTVQAVAPDGRSWPLAVTDMQRLRRADVDHVELGLCHPLLRSIEILDLPGLREDEPKDSIGHTALIKAHLAIWCTLASKAFPASEQAAWVRLPARFRTTGMLVATHQDALPDAGKSAEVRSHLASGARSFGHDPILLATQTAQAARPSGGAVLDEAMWQASGGAAFCKTLFQALSVVAFQRRRAATHARHHVAGDRSSQPPGKVKPAASALDKILEASMDETPSCLASACVDLGTGLLLGVVTRRPHAPEILDLVAAATADLFDGSRFQGMEVALARGGTDERPVREVIIFSDNFLHLFMRDHRQGTYVLVQVTQKASNVGVVISKGRKTLTELSGMMYE